jgi:uncharacterized delta-60 repeat protein
MGILRRALSLTVTFSALLATLSLACSSDDEQPAGPTDDAGGGGDGGPIDTRLNLKLEPPAVIVAPGGEVKVKVKLDKPGSGQLQIRDLPPRATATPVDVEGKTEAELKITAAPDAPQTNASARVVLEKNATVSAALGVRVRGKPGDLDLPFGLVGYASAPLSANPEDAYAVALQADGAIVVAGAASGAGGDGGPDERWVVARFTADGKLDTTFGKGGHVVLDDRRGQARALAVQADGKILVGGWALDGTVERGFVVRLDKNGAADASFGTGGAAKFFDKPTQLSRVFGIVQRKDGKVVAGGLRQEGSATDLFFSLMSGAGAVETTGIAGVSVEYTEAALVADGEGFALAGTAPTAKTKDFAFARFGKDGALLASFGTGGKLIADTFGGHDLLHALAPVDGGLIAAGEIEQTAGGEKGFGTLRVNAKGAEAKWGTGGAQFTTIGNGADAAHAVIGQNDGHVVVLGQATPTGAERGNMAIARFGTDGALDPTFEGRTGSKGRVLYNAGILRSVVLQPDGRIVAAGTFTAKEPREIGVIRVWH